MTGQYEVESDLSDGPSAWPRKGGMRFLIKSAGLEKGCQGKRQFSHQARDAQVLCMCVQEIEKESACCLILLNVFTSYEPVLIFGDVLQTSSVFTW